MSKRVDWFVTELNITGGTEVFLRQTAPLLREAGWDLRVITLISGGKLIAALRQDGDDRFRAASWRRLIRYPKVPSASGPGVIYPGADRNKTGGYLYPAPHRAAQILTPLSKFTLFVQQPCLWLVYLTCLPWLACPDWPAWPVRPAACLAA